MDKVIYFYILTGFGMVDHGRTGFLECNILLGSGRTNRMEGCWLLGWVATWTLVWLSAIALSHTQGRHGRTTGGSRAGREDQNSFSNPQIT